VGIKHADHVPRENDDQTGSFTSSHHSSNATRGNHPALEHHILQPARFLHPFFSLNVMPPFSTPEKIIWTHCVKHLLALTKTAQLNHSTATVSWHWASYHA